MGPRGGGFRVTAGEELLVALAGRVSVRTPEGARELERGDVFLFRSGPEGTQKDVARAIAFLVSDDVAYISGACLVADGGLSNAVGPEPSDDG